jgi:hypothetical protein
LSVRRRLIGGVASIALVASACGGSSAGSGGSSAGSGGSTSITIEQPEDGASVQVPFTVEVSSGVELGSPETGNHHFHLFFDDNSDEYEVVNGPRFVVREVPGSGEHTINVSLRNADHSEAGPEDSVSVTVAGGGAGGGKGEDSDDDGGYGY